MSAIVKIFAFVTGLILTCSHASAQRQFVVGDMDNDGQITATDVAQLVATAIGRIQPRTIEVPDITDVSTPTALAGSWISDAGHRLTLNADGSAAYDAEQSVARFEYYPCSRDLILLVSDGTTVVADYHLLRKSDDELTLRLPAGGYVYLHRATTDGQAHEYVDLGLASGTLWATCNLGADSPEDAGNFYAWAEVDPKTSYTTATLLDLAADGKTYLNYNCDYGGRQTLRSADDAARQNWGSDWAVPTSAQMQELAEQCVWTWTTLNGKTGYQVASRDGSHHIFLPAAGYRSGTKLQSTTTDGRYWTNTLYSGSAASALILKFTQSAKTITADARSYGFSIRPVRARQ